MTTRLAELNSQLTRLERDFDRGHHDPRDRVSSPYTAFVYGPRTCVPCHSLAAGLYELEREIARERARSYRPRR